MKSRERTAIMALCLGMSAWGQTQIDLRTQSKNVDFSQAASTRPVRMGAVLPASCTSGEMFYWTIASVGQELRVCTEGAVWIPVTSGDSGLPTVVGQPVGRILIIGSNGAQWGDLTGDATGNAAGVVVGGLQGRPVRSTVPQPGDVLQWNGSSNQWEPAAAGGTNYTPGLGLVITDTTIAIADALVPFYSTGFGAPAISCTAGRDLYTDLTSGKFYFCEAADVWDSLALASHQHAASDLTSGILSAGLLPAFTGDMATAQGSAAATVTGLQQRAVSAAAPTAGQMLAWNGTSNQWGPISISGTSPLAYNGTTGQISCSGCEQTSAKGAPSGYAALGADGLVPNTQIASNSAQAGLYLAGNRQWKALAATEVTGLAASAKVDATTLSGSYASLTATACTSTNLMQPALPTDSAYPLLRCNGAGNWDPWRNNRKLTAPPATGWSWVNQGLATWSTATGAGELVLPAGSGTPSLRGLVRSVPATPPYQVEVLGECSLSHAGATWGAFCGLVLRESASGKIEACGLWLDNDNATRLAVASFTNESTLQTKLAGLVVTTAPGSLWLQYRDDGTNRIFSFSRDGHLWTEFYRESRTAFLVADQWGWSAASALSTAVNPSAVLWHWAVN